VKQGTKIAHGFAIHNSTPVPVTVQGLEFSMPGMTARFAPLIAHGLRLSTVNFDRGRSTVAHDASRHVAYAMR
jgi:hypothetical protein